MLNLSEPKSLIWLVSSDKTETIARTFIRFQEYYENPVFKGKKGITVQEIEDWWSSRLDRVDYYSHWAGFNIPGWVILDIVKSNTYYPLTPLEHQLIGLFEDVPSKDLCQGVVIGVGKDLEMVFEHEFAHGLFGTDLEYRKQQLSNIAQLDSTIRVELETQLYRMGYHRSVIVDEIQAYLSTFPTSLPNTFPDVFRTEDMVLEHSLPFQNTFNAFTVNLQV